MSAAEAGSPFHRLACAFLSGRGWKAKTTFPRPLCSYRSGHMMEDSRKQERGRGNFLPLGAAWLTLETPVFPHTER